MARKVITQYVDDLDGSEAAGSFPFSLEGVDYEIDLNDENAQTLRDALEPFIKGGRRVGGRRKNPTAQAHEGVDMNEVRAWGRSNGYEVSDRGRVAGNVLDAYRAAQGK